MIQRRGFLAACIAALAAPLAWFRKPDRRVFVDRGENWVCYDKSRLAEEPRDIWYVGVNLDSGGIVYPGPIVIREYPSGRLSVSSNGEEWKPQISEKPWLIYRLDRRGGIRFRRNYGGEGMLPVHVDWFWLSDKPTGFADVQYFPPMYATTPAADESFGFDWV